MAALRDSGAPTTAVLRETRRSANRGALRIAALRERWCARRCSEQRGARRDGARAGGGPSTAAFQENRRQKPSLKKALANLTPKEIAHKMWYIHRAGVPYENLSWYRFAFAAKPRLLLGSTVHDQYCRGRCAHPHSRSGVEFTAGRTRRGSHRCRGERVFR